MKIDLFQSCGSCWVFQICWHSECSTLIALSFGIWNSSAGIASHPLALFVIVLLLKAHLTLYFRMSGSRWVITPLCFFQVIKTFLCHFVFLPHSSLEAQLIKNPPAMQEIPVRFLGREDPLGGGGMATHSSILAWRIPTDWGAGRATVHGITKSQTRLSI